MLYNPEKILQTEFLAILMTGIYGEATRLWQIEAAVDQTWNNFSKHLSEKYHNIKRYQKITETQGVYHSANKMIDATAEILQALDNPEMAETADRDRVEQLNGVVRQITENKKQLTEKNKSLTAHMKLLTETNMHLIKQLDNRGGQQGGRNQEEGKRILAYKQKLDLRGYFWSHGHKVEKVHTRKS